MGLKNPFELVRSQLLDRSLLTEIPVNPTKVEVDWRIATADDIDALTEEDFRYDERRKEFSRQNLAEGNICVIGYVDEVPGHVGWITFKRLYSFPFELPLGEGWIYLQRARTSPKFPGLGLHGAGIAKRLEVAREAGAVRSVNMVDLNNEISLHNFHKLGFIDWYKIWGLGFNGRRLIDRIPANIKATIAAPATSGDANG